MSKIPERILKVVSEAFQNKATPGQVPELESGVEHDRPTSDTAKLSVIDDLCVGCSYCLMTCKDNALIVEGVCVVIEDNCTDCLRCLLWCPTGALVYSEEK